METGAQLGRAGAPVTPIWGGRKQDQETESPLDMQGVLGQPGQQENLTQKNKENKQKVIN